MPYADSVRDVRDGVTHLASYISWIAQSEDCKLLRDLALTGVEARDSVSSKFLRTERRRR
jgi:hypothetical protein